MSGHTPGPSDMCSKRIVGDTVRGSQCCKPPKYFEGGKWWCSIHCKAAVKARDAKREERHKEWRDRFAAKMKAENDRARKVRCFPTLLAACEGTLNPNSIGTMNNQRVMRMAVAALCSEGHKTLAAEIEAIADAQSAAIKLAKGEA